MNRSLIFNLLNMIFVMTACNSSFQPAIAGEIFDPKPAPQFKAKTLEDETLELKELKGKIILLEFWRRECSDCMVTMDKLVEIRKEISKDQLVIIGINCDVDVTLAENFLRRKPAEWPQIHARSQEKNLIDLYKVKDLPAFCLIDAEGRLFYRGERVKIDEIMKIVAPHLSEVPSGNSE